MEIDPQDPMPVKLAVLITEVRHQRQEIQRLGGIIEEMRDDLVEARSAPEKIKKNREDLEWLKAKANQLIGWATAAGLAGAGAIEAIKRGLGE